MHAAAAVEPLKCASAKVKTNFFLAIECKILYTYRKVEALYPFSFFSGSVYILPSLLFGSSHFIIYIEMACGATLEGSAAIKPLEQAENYALRRSDIS